MATETGNTAEERCQRDKETLVACCSSCKFVSVKSLAADSVILEFIKGEKKMEYTILFTPDYPRNTVVTSTNDQSDVKCIEQPVMTIFTKLCKDWCQAHDISITDLPQEIQSLFSKDTSSLPNPQTNLCSQISVSSSVGSSDMSEGSDYDDYYNSDTYEVEEVLNPLLEQDIETLIKIHGKNSVEYRVHAGINEVDVLLYIDMGFLDIHTASAWGVNTEEPVVIQLHLQSASDYLDGPEPKVEVFQATPSSKERRKFGLGTQIQKVTETFVYNQWKTISNYHLSQHLERVVPEPSTPPSATVITPTNTPPAHSKGLPKFLQKLLDMGFPSSSAEQAMDLCGEDVDKAVHLLTTGELVEQDDDDNSSKKAKTETGSPLERPTSLSRQDSQGARATLSQLDSLENVKRIPPLDNGYLGQVLQYILERIPSLNEFCVICDDRHILETGLLRPCVCTRELCVFAFQTLGVMADAAESIATDASVVDLLIAMCHSAATSNRAQLILDPYPSIVDPSNSQRFAMDPAKKDYDQVKKIMKSIISGREQLVRGRCSYSSLKEVLDSHNRLAFPLMQWIVATNRAYIVLIPEDRQLKSMNTKYQFLLISSPPSKEAAFQRAKAKDGSTFAFHGSSIENWHSIMRKGLINASGTRFQLHGAAYGSGIYLSPRSGTSFGYTNRFYGQTISKQEGGDTLAGKLNLTCIALCEVVTSKDLKKSGDIWVCPQSDHVVTRFFFVYDQIGLQTTDLNTQDKDFKKEITYAIQLAQKLKKI